MRDPLDLAISPRWAFSLDKVRDLFANVFASDGFGENATDKFWAGRTVGFARGAIDRPCERGRVTLASAAVENTEAKAPVRGNVGMGITSAPATIRCSCSTSLAIWSAAPCVPATFTAPTAGKAF
jgi:hypothetical protein